MTDEKKTPGPRPVVQKAFRLTLDHELKLYRMMARLRDGERPPAALAEQLTPGRELCESDVVGAAIAHAESMLSPWRDPNESEG